MSTAQTEVRGLRDITNRSDEPRVVSKKPASEWCGTHIRFDDEGNREVIVRDTPQENIRDESVDEPAKPEVEEQEQVVDENDAGDTTGIAKFTYFFYLLLFRR
jgi:hypothetical protein